MMPALATLISSCSYCTFTLRHSEGQDGWIAHNAFVLCVKQRLRFPVLLVGFPNASQEDAKIEKTAKSAQKGLEKSAQNVTPDTSDLSNPFDGAGGIADKVCMRIHTHLPGYRSG